MKILIVFIFSGLLFSVCQAQTYFKKPLQLSNFKYDIDVREIYKGDVKYSKLQHRNFILGERLIRTDTFSEDNKNDKMLIAYSQQNASAIDTVALLGTIPFNDLSMTRTMDNRLLRLNAIALFSDRF